MRKGFRAFSVVLAVVILQGCAPDTTTAQLPPGAAAVVNGTTITRDQVVQHIGELHDFRNLTGEERAFFSSRLNEEERGTLEQYIFADVFRKALTEQGLVFAETRLSQYQTDSLENAGGISQLRRSLQPSGLTVDVFNQAYLVQQVVFAQLREQLIVGLSAEFRTVRHILVDNEGLAEALIERLIAGEAFADLAGEYSTDSGSAIAGGDLGSALPGAYVAAFEAAVWSSEGGLVREPVATDFGFHIIDVQAIDVVSAENMEENDQFALIQTELNAILLGALDRAHIRIDSAYGRWDARSRTVVPLTPIGAARL